MSELVGNEPAEDSVDGRGEEDGGHRGDSGCGEEGHPAIESTDGPFRKRWRTPAHSSRSTDRGSSRAFEVVSKRIVALRLRSYFGQPGSPFVANATQAACIVSASCRGGSGGCAADNRLGCLYFSHLV